MQAAHTLAYPSNGSGLQMRRRRLRLLLTGVPRIHSQMLNNSTTAWQESEILTKVHQTRAHQTNTVNLAFESCALALPAHAAVDKKSNATWKREAPKYLCFARHMVSRKLHDGPAVPALRSGSCPPRQARPAHY